MIFWRGSKNQNWTLSKKLEGGPKKGVQKSPLIGGFFWTAPFWYPPLNARKEESENAT